jgi:hypothetical protein
MSAKSIRFMTVTASTPDADLFRYLIAISSGITVPGLMEMVGKLPSGANSNKLGHLAMGSCLNIRKVIDEVRTKAAVTLSDDWTVNGGMNFSCFALLGHLLMKLPEEAMTPMLKEAIAPYRASLGGANSLDDFSQANVTEGKEVRGEILMKWKGQLKDVKMDHYRTVLAAKFPKLVLDSRNIVRRTIESVISFTLSPISMAYNLTSAVLGSVYSILSYSIYIIFLAIMISVFLNSGLAKTSYVIYNAGAEAPSSVLNVGVMKSVVSSPSSAFSYALPFSYGMASAVMGNAMAYAGKAFTLATDIPELYGKVTSEENDAENPFLEVMEEYFGEISVNKVKKMVGEFADSVMTAAFSPLADEEYGSYIAETDTKYMANLGEAFREDMESIPMIGDALGRAVDKAIKYISEMGIDTAWIAITDVPIEMDPEEVFMMDAERDSFASRDGDAFVEGVEEELLDMLEDEEVPDF